jgi:glycosyltransferase involved in cell wall biosynthesis
MKILQIIPSLNKGGAERLVIDICNNLTKINNLIIKLIVFSPDNSYDSDMANIEYSVISDKIQLSLIKKNIFEINNLQIAIDEFKPDIIHTHLFETEIVSRSCHYPQAKWFSHCHDNMKQFENFSLKTLFSKQKLTNYYEKKYLFKRYQKNGGTHFIAIGNDTQKYFEKTAKPYPVTKITNAIDYNKFFKPKELNEKQQIVITNTGSFVNKKNQAFILEIAKELEEKNIDFRINLLGDGVNRKPLMEKTENLQLSKNIHFHGNVNNVEEFLWESDIYLHTATYEPLGLVLLEAMAAGLPVITLDGKGNRDLIEQGKNGYMIYEQNPELFAQTIIDLCNNKQKYSEISAYAQEYAKKYDIKEYVEKLLKLYREAIDG